MPDPRLLAPGTLLAQRYEIASVVGRGGMSAVYRASDRRLPKAVWAIKEMWADALAPEDRDEAQRLFEREVTILAALSHPALPRVCDTFSENGKQYMVMEFLEGETLEAVVSRQGPIEVCRALRWAVRLADALAYLHERPEPVVFRDMKPPNVMIMANGDIKVIDFGIARFYSDGKHQDTVPFGTPGFAAPEQYGRAQSDPRVDVYGLGATLHYLLTARDPAETVFHFPPPSSLQAGVPPEVDALLGRALALEPADRFPRMREMQSALQHALAAVEAGLSAPPVTSAPTVPLAAPPPIVPAMPVTAPAAAPGSVPRPSATPSTQPLTSLSQGTSGPAFEQAALDFGTVRRGEVQRLNVRVLGEVDGALVSDSRRWLRCEPRRPRGRDPVIQVTVYTSSLREARTHHGLVTLRDKGGDLHLPVRVTLEPTRVSLLSVLLATVLALTTLVPAAGLGAALLFALQYFTCPLDERPALRPFAFVIAALALCNAVLVAGVVLFMRLRGQPAP